MVASELAEGSPEEDVEFGGDEGNDDSGNPHEYDETRDRNNEDTNIVPLYGETIAQLDSIHDGMLCDDPGRQEDVTRGLRHDHITQNQYLVDIEDQPIEDISYQRLKELYEGRNEKEAVKLLGKRVQLFFPPDWLISSDDPFLVWQPLEARLDSKVVVGNSLGFEAIIPTVHAVNWSFQLKPKLSFKQWNDKHSFLGIDPVGRMSFLGYLESKLVYFLYVPYNDDDTPQQGSKPSGPTCLSPPQRRREALFLAKMMETSGIKDIYCVDWYADVSQDVTFDRTTNLWSGDGIELDRDQVIHLQENIKENYEFWAQNSPWNDEDNFFVTNFPVVVFGRYGQDREMFAMRDPGRRMEERAEMIREGDYSKYAFLTVAVATHPQVRLADHFRPADLDYLLSRAPLYDSPDPRDRARLAVDVRNEYPDGFHPQGRYHFLWDEQGEAVQTSVPGFDDDSDDRAGDTYCPIFWDSESVERTFTYYADTDDEDDGRPFKEKHYKYPMCNSKEICNIQARGPPACYRPVVNRINQEVLDSWGRRNGREAALERGPAVQVESFQAYNTVSHKMRRDKDLHDASKGMVTSALAGSMACSAVHRRRFKKLLQSCDTNLPHERFQHKLTKDRFTKSLRLELVVVINMHAIHKDDRNGGYIYDLLLDLVDGWQTDGVWTELVSSWKILHPECMPGLFKWTGYPFMSAISALWKYAREHLFANSGVSVQPVWWKIIELISLMERLLLNSQTGNMAVVPSRMAKQLYAYQGLCETGWPTCHGGLNLNESPLISIATAAWPSFGGTILLNSQAAIEYAYSRAVFYILSGDAELEWILECRNDVVPHGVQPSVHRYEKITKAIADLYVQECLQLVYNGIKAEIMQELDRGLNFDDGWQEQRLEALESWKILDHPFSGSKESLAFLLRALSPTQRHMLQDLPPASPPRTPIDAFVEDMFGNALLSPDVAMRTAPLSTGGRVAALLSASIRATQQYFLGSSAERQKLVFTSAIEKAFRTAKLNICPSTLPRTGRAGRPHRMLSHKSWLRLNVNPQRNLQSLQNLLPQCMQTHQQFSQFAEILANDNPIAPWKVLEAKVNEFSTYFGKTIPPDEFQPVDANITDPLVHEIFMWANSAFNMGNPVHKIAVFYGAIVAHALPNIRLDITGKLSHDINTFKETIFGLDFLQCGRGASEPLSWYSVFVVAFMAYGDSRSPLRIKERQVSDTKVFKAWREKIYTKFIKPVLFIRLSVAELTKGGSQAMHHGIHWKMLDEDALGRQLKKLENKVERGIAIDVYNLVARMVGVRNTENLVKMNYLLSP